MIHRDLAPKIEGALAQFPAVALLGPRQAGKSTLARALCAARGNRALLLDLERPTDRALLAEPELFFRAHADTLLVLDEIQRVPELFTTLKSVVDDRRAQDRRACHFLLLGSASIELLRQSAESLAGRITYLYLTGFSYPEVRALSRETDSLNTLWVRGGFPDSFLAQSDAQSIAWREAFISTYLERDIPALGPRIPSETLRRFWTMLAHLQGTPHNAAHIAAGLGISGQTVARYTDLLVDLLLVRRLPAWHSNVGKRLVRSPKVYVRDSGVVHALLGIATLDILLGHPVVGMSWEGFVVEQVLTALPHPVHASYYRTATGIELDLVLEYGTNITAIEIKRTLTPSSTPGFRTACADVGATRRFVVYPGTERFPLDADTEAMPLGELLTYLQAQ